MSHSYIPQKIPTDGLLEQTSELCSGFKRTYLSCSSTPGLSTNVDIYISLRSLSPIFVKQRWGDESATKTAIDDLRV